MENVAIKNLLPISMILLAIFLANVTSKTAVVQSMTHKVMSR